jgi:PKHD-type hydroxylase
MPGCCTRYPTSRTRRLGKIPYHRPAVSAGEIVNSLLWPPFLTDHECEAAIELVSAAPREMASTEQGRDDRRRCDVGWLHRDHTTEWLFEKFETLGLDYASRRQIDVEYLNDPLQFALYSADSVFDWHIDTGSPETISRKITISTQLSRPDEYDGGDLELVGESITMLRRIRGSALAFPSVIGHRITRISRGTRLALVGWMHGPPYR